MRETILSDGRRRYVYDYRGPNGPTKIKGTLNLTDPQISDIIKFKAALIEKAENRSLKTQAALFEDAVDIVIKTNGGAGMIWVYNRIRRDLAGPMDKTYLSRYHRFIDVLEAEGKAKNTISNYKAAIQRTINTAYNRGMIDNKPIREYGIKRRHRDRVLSGEERLRLENEMVRCNSHLFWSIKFAERRPIRSHSELWKLSRSNLVLFGDDAPYIEMVSQKTRLATVYPLRDFPEMVQYFYALPPDCPYLFPKIELDGTWKHMGDPRVHFSTLLKNSKIEDFHFHDFKRIATTHMIDNGYTSDELIDLRIYASRAMIDKCYKKRDAKKVLRRISVGLNVGHEGKMCANDQ